MAFLTAFYLTFNGRARPALIALVLLIYDWSLTAHGKKTNELFPSDSFFTFHSIPGSLTMMLFQRPYGVFTYPDFLLYKGIEQK